MIGVPNPIITFFGFDQYRQNYWIRTQNGEQVSRVVVIVYQKSLNLYGKNCILSCSRGRRSRLFVVTASLSHTIEKLHNFLKRPECWAVKCQGWITILSSTSGLYFGIWMKEKQHQHHLNAKHISIKMFYFFRMMCDLWIIKKYECI